jgi:hypothetical protein
MKTKPARREVQWKAAAVMAVAWGILHAGAIQLKIQSEGGEIVVRWPTNATGFTLQMANQFPPTNGWIDAPQPPVAGTDFRHAESSGLVTRFFRLFKANATQPILSSFTVLTNQVPLGGSAALQFTYYDPECDIFALHLVVSNALGVVTQQIAAPSLGITNVNANISLSFGSGGLALGQNLVSIQLRDRLGFLSDAATVALELVGAGAGGAVPQVTTLVAQKFQSGWPGSGGAADTISRVRVPFTLGYSDPDGDIERMRVTVFDPVFSITFTESLASSVGATGTNGSVTFFPLVFGNTNRTGTYTVQVELIDRNGNVSAPRAAVAVLSAFLVTQPAISFFTPLTGRAGTLVSLNAANLSRTNLDSFFITLGGVRVPVLTNNGTALVIQVPPGASSGRFVMRTTNLIVASAGSFIVPTNLVINPEFTRVPAGESVEFTVRRDGSPLTPLIWSVNGAPGGNANVGTVTTNGVYQSPAFVPTNTGVTVTVAAQPNTNIFTSALVIVEPTVLPPSNAVISAISGGRLLAAEGGAWLEIPPAALPTNTTISIHTPPTTNWPSPEAGMDIAGVVELKPDGLVLAQPGKLTISLPRGLTPGTQFPAKLFNPGTSNYVDEGVLATVATDGVHATALVPHFSIWVFQVPQPISPPPAGAVQIGNIEAPVEVLEGMTIPIRVIGNNFGGIREASIPPSPYVGSMVSQLIVETNRIGFLLTLPVLAKAEGEFTPFRVLLNDGTNSINVDIPVHWLDEIILTAGQQLVLLDPLPRRYSLVSVLHGATVKVVSGKLDWSVTRSVEIFDKFPGSGQPAGTLDASGNSGRDGDGVFGGAAGGDAGFGGNAGEPGGNADLVVPGGSISFPRGLGGLPGNVSDALNTFTLFLKLNGCQIVGGANQDCRELAADLLEIERFEDFDYDYSDPLPTGKVGWPGAVHSGSFPRGGHGGGGGGGSGFVSFIAEADGNEAGGGGGGGAGRGLRIVSAGDIVVNGNVLTHGGRGGDGERLTGVPYQDASAVIFAGGSGGGGSAGELILQAGNTVTVGSDAEINTKGGASGFGGFYVYDASAQNQRRVVFRGFDDLKAANGNKLVAGPAFSPAVLDHQVTAASVLELYEPQPGDRAAQIEIRGEQSGQVRMVRVRGFESPYLRSSYSAVAGTTILEHILEPPYRANLVLFPGFNTIIVHHGEPDREPADAPAYELLRKYILSMPGADSDGDGISDADETRLGMNPNSSDSDQDGLNDTDELLAGSDATSADSDGDGLTDAQEIAAGTNPGHRDTDRDGASDGVEVILGSSPLPLERARGYCPLEQGAPPGTLFAQTQVRAGGFQLSIIDPATARVGTVGRPNGGFGFGLGFDGFGNFYVSRYEALAKSREAYCLEPVGPMAQLAVANSVGGGSPGAATPMLVINPLETFIGSVVFGPTNNSPMLANALRLDPLIADLAGNIPVTDSFLYGSSGGETIRIHSIALRSDNQVIFGVGTDFNGSPTGQFWWIQPGFGTVIPYGPTLAAPVRALAFTPANALFGVQIGAPSDLLVRLDNPAAPVVIGLLGWTNIQGLAWHPSGQLYASVVTNSGPAKISHILLVNPTNATTTVVATVPVEVYQIAFAPCPAPCFAPPLASPASSSPTQIRAADFDKDGNDDIVELGANTGSQGAAITLLRSGINGSFAQTIKRVLTTTGSPGREVAIADFNNDTWPDVAALAHGVGIAVLLNDGAGGLNAPTNLTLPQPAGSLDAGDVTGDGLPDLVATVGFDGIVTLWPGDGAGGFGAPTTVMPTNSPFVVQIVRLGDFNNNGALDILAIDSTEAHVALGHNNGTFDPPLDTTVNYESGDIAMDDFNGDSIPDLLLLRYGTTAGFKLMRGTGNGTFGGAVTSRFGGPGYIAAFATGDLSGDGAPDIAFSVPSDGLLHCWFNDGAGNFSAARNGPISAPPHVAELAIGDFNGDGQKDLAGLNSLNNQILGWLRQ